MKFLVLILLTLALRVVHGADEMCIGVPNGSLLPNPKDCATFYQCSNGNAFLLTCPAGLHFAVSMNQCEAPEVAQCKEIDDETTTQSTTTATQSPTTTQSTTPTTLTPTSSSSTTSTKIPGNDDDEEFECPENKEELEYFPSKTSCSEYYMCYNGEAFPMNCGEGLYWNQELGVCSNSQDVECNLDEGSSPATTANTPTTAPSTTPSTVSTAPDTSTTTIQPTTTQSTTQSITQSTTTPSPSSTQPPETTTLPSSSLSTSSTISSSSSTPSISSTTNSPSLTQCQPTGQHFIPYPKRCERYIFCYEGIEIPQQCPYLHNYDFLESVCKDKKVARCYVE